MPLNIPFNNFFTNFYNMAANPRLHGFIDRQSDSPPPQPPSPSPRLQPQPQPQQRADRQAMAKNLRIGSKKQKDSSANMNRAHNSEPAYDQPTGFSQRNTVHGGDQMYPDYTQQENRDKFDDSTVAEDFDDTVSQGNFSNGQNMAVVGVDDFDNRHVREQVEQDNFQDPQDNRYNMRSPDESDFGHNHIDGPVPHQPHKIFHQYNGPHTQALGESLYKQSQTPKIIFQPHLSPLPQHNSPTKQKISGRFNQSRHLDTLTNRQKNGVQAVESSRKRTSDEGVFSPLPKAGKSQVVEDLENAIPREIPPYNIPPPRSENMQSPQIDGSSDEEEYSEDSSRIKEQPALQSRPVERFPPANPQQNGAFNLATIQLDYDDATLKNMDYSQLRDESFEAPSAASEQPSEPDMSLSDRTLNERVSYHVEQYQAADQKELDKQRVAMAEFFGNLSKDEWEEAGDWFLERFADTLKALKDARKEKRDVVAKFEREIEKREGEVKGSLRAYNEDMERMKKGAKGVIEGKML
ncbi:5c5d79d9-0ba6-4c73-be9f-ad34576d7419 [Sclerotinia trifoliorum]|uniref:5c5d79d9-0ba6-4c73-be9f-ad34576d7419 n=1 Tax=Sclerotinia trifoliorum TaxID=28548 RepID=A0A8H2W607_9HELO|nr:5c5d79d9-0ba6-4c73-be9f-ad34576d7419 [Sclerotinia trifoliorum]